MPSPRNLSVINVMSKRVILHWTAPNLTSVSNNTVVRNYIVQWNDTQLMTNKTNATITDLTPNQIYEIFVRTNFTGGYIGENVSVNVSTPEDSKHTIVMYSSQ